MERAQNILDSRCSLVLQKLEAIVLTRFDAAIVFLLVSFPIFISSSWLEVVEWNCQSEKPSVDVRVDVEFWIIFFFGDENVCRANSTHTYTPTHKHTRWENAHDIVHQILSGMGSGACWNESGIRKRRKTRMQEMWKSTKLNVCHVNLRFTLLAVVHSARKYRLAVWIRCLWSHSDVRSASVDRCSQT